MSASSRYRRLRALKRRFDAVVVAIAWYAGWAGLAALLGLLALRVLPAGAWDIMPGLRAEHWPVYAMVALITAGLLGFSLVNRGQDRIKKRLGSTMSAIVFAMLPLLCLAATLWALYAREQPSGGPWWLFVRWYPPVVTILCAATFLAWKARPRKHVYVERGFGYALLLAPYALLFATLELGVQFSWLDESWRETLTALGSTAIVLQLVLAFFISTPD